MSDVIASSAAKSVELQAVVIRADGTREDLGTIAYWHRNPFKLAWWRIKKFFRDPPILRALSRK